MGFWLHEEEFSKACLAAAILWQQELPEGTEINIETLLPTIKGVEGPGGARENLATILRNGGLPEPQVWHAALVEQWSVTREIEELDPTWKFFALDEQVASKFLLQLADSLYMATGTDPPRLAQLILKDRLETKLLRSSCARPDNPQASRSSSDICLKEMWQR